VGRQIIGIKGFGISAPLLMGFAFAATGIRVGLLIFIIALLLAYIIRFLLQDLRLLYLPKLALIISGVTLSIYFLIPFLPFVESIQFPYAAFSLIILILMVEQFYAFLIERGIRKTFGIALETLALAITTFLVVTWQFLQDIVLTYPLLVILAVIIVNILLGRWTGIRFSEYLRFKDILFK
jgi:hypothetical protein